MKKKLINLILIFCLVFPCFFSVACSEKESPSKQLSYTYSITLKNAKGKVEENSLPLEYDFQKNQNIAYSLSGEDYKISVTKSIPLSGEIKFGLLEGVDYSNINLKVNNKDEEFFVKNDNSSSAAGEVTLTGRYFEYSFQKMKSNTDVVVDFSNCETAKVSIDVSNLKQNGVKHLIVEDDFLTLTEAKNKINLFETFSTTTLQVDYGTILAFDYSEQLAYAESSSDGLQKMSFASYGSKYLVGENRIQYFTAQKSGRCEVYSIVDDHNKDGTIRSVFGDDVKFAASLEDLENQNYATTTIEKESFDGNALSVAVYKEKSESVFLELDADYSYYLVDKLDGKLADQKVISTSPNVIANTERKYVEISLTDAEGNLLPAQYLARRPKTAANYYYVYLSGLGDAVVKNADFVLVGTVNTPLTKDNYPEISAVFYGFKKVNEVALQLSVTTQDKNTNFGRVNNSAQVAVQRISGGVNETISSESKTPAISSLINLECCKGDDISATNSSVNPLVYSINVSYTYNPFQNADMKLSIQDLNLYAGEKVYYTTNLRSIESWKQLSSSDSLQISHADESTIYYYIESARNDAALQILNEDDESIGISGALVDCFGRTMETRVEINGKTINLSQVQYIEIEPGYYSASQQLKLVRDYDKAYHKINAQSITQDDFVMISFDGYNSNSFADIKDVLNAQIRTESDFNSTVYYYINSTTTKYLSLINSSGVDASSTELVYVNGSPLKIGEKFVFSLSLNCGHYAEGEEFSVEIHDAIYALSDANGVLLTYRDDAKNVVDDLVCGDIYFVVTDGTSSSSFEIVDKSGSVIVTHKDIHYKKPDVSGKVMVYFRFNFGNGQNYAPGTEFRIKKI